MTEIAARLAHLLAVHSQVEHAEDVGQSIVAVSRQTLRIVLGAEPQRSLHEDVEENVVLSEKLADTTPRILPERSIFRGLRPLAGQRELRERNRCDERVGPHIERLAGHSGSMSEGTGIPHATSRVIERCAQPSTKSGLIPSCSTSILAASRASLVSNCSWILCRSQARTYFLCGGREALPAL